MADIKRILNFQPKHKTMFLEVFKHFIPYFENPDIEDLEINEFGKLTLRMRGGIKLELVDDNFSKYNLQTVMSLCGEVTNQIEENQQISLMLPINNFRFTGCMGSLMKSGVWILIRLDDEEQIGVKQMSIEEKKHQELSNLRGRMFRVKERKKENSPTHSGRIKIDNQEYWINGWVSETKDSGEKYFSLSCSKVTEQDLPASNIDEIDEEIPF